MIVYPSGNWKTDLEIPQDFFETFKHYFENVRKEYATQIRHERFERLFILWLCAKEAAKLDGDFVESGVYAGETAYFMAKQCRSNFHLFDSWQGADDFTEFDNDFYKSFPFKIDIEVCQKFLSEFNNLKYHKGKVPFEFEKVEKISLLHIDLDNYIPTRVSLEQLWDKVVDGGYVIVDFHDSVASGAEKATRDFFEKAGKEIKLFPTGKAIVVK